MPTKEEVTEILKQCYDPEIPVNIVDLGLIYDLNITDEEIGVKMTLTAQGCPMHTQITQDVQKKLLEGVPGLKKANVEIVWNPPWDPSRISKEAKLKLGMETE